MDLRFFELDEKIDTATITCFLISLFIFLS
jgi:hypothetical protein